jgi:kynurenine formamidase
VELSEVGRRFIDLSIPICNDVVSDPEALRPRITYWAHGETFHQMAPFFPGLTQQELPDGEAWAVEDVQLTTHSGTHMDAPWHYHSTSEGLRAPAIDEAPLDLFLRPGVKLDFRHFGDGYVATAADVVAELNRIGHELRPFDIVLVNTTAGAAYGSADYVSKGCGVGAEATLFLTSHGVRVVGTDAWSWDAPFIYTARRYAESRNADIIWEGHKAGRIRGYYQMEKLHGLEGLPSHGFLVACFPVKIKGASAGWTRAVAILDE